MKKRIVIIFSLFILIWIAGFLIESISYTADNNDMVSITHMESTDDYYAVVNANDNVLVLKTNSSGRVLKVVNEDGSEFKTKVVMLDTIDITDNESSVFYLTRAYDENYDAVYSITQTGPSLGNRKCTVTDVFDYDVNPSTVYADDTNIYITAINDARDTCYVYKRAIDALDTENFSILTQATIDGNRFMLYALYDGTSIEAYLDSGSCVYFQNGEAQYEESSMSTLGSKLDMLKGKNIKVGSVVSYFACSTRTILRRLVVCLVMAAVISACYVMYSSRRYAFRQLAIFLGDLLVLHLLVYFAYMTAFTAYTGVCYQDSQKVIFEYMNHRYSLDNAFFLNSTEYYATDDYAKAYSDLADLWAKSRSIEQLYLVHIEGDNRLVLASLNMDRETAAQYISTDRFLSLATKAKISGDVEGSSGSFMGNECAYFVVPLTGDSTITKYIFGVVRMDSYDQELGSMRVILSWFNLITMIGCSVIAYFYAMSLTADIRHFSGLMLSPNTEAILEKKPKTTTLEVEKMWNALTELLKRFDRLNYAKLLMMEAYYRFSPRKMEEIMHKESITDVKVGDLCEIEATMATVFLQDKKRLDDNGFAKRVNEEFKLIGYHQNEHDGIVISMNYELSQIRLLFMKEPAQAVEFALHTASDLANYDSRSMPTIFLHSGHMIYGILGGEEQAFPYTRCKDMDCLGEMTNVLSKLHGGIFLTDSVGVGMSLANGYRFIGNIYPKGMTGVVKLYQLIDVYGADTRTKYIANNTIFEQALEFFEKKDFYRARNLFSQVIKTNGADEVARWYTFTCEEMMNNDK